MSDDSLPSNHMYFWACDMRNPGGSSFVEVHSLSQLLGFFLFFLFNKLFGGISTCLDPFFVLCLVVLSNYRYFP
jgi:hypothetical protein